jgi:hypothetical protein
VTAPVVVMSPSSTYTWPRAQVASGFVLSRAGRRDQWLVALRPASIPVSRSGTDLRLASTGGPSLDNLVVSGGCCDWW